MKILIISPTPTHPVNAGNRIRIFTFCELLRQKGYELHFLYIDEESSDIARMTKYFNGNLHVFKPKAFLKSCNVVEKAQHFLYRKKKRIGKQFRKAFSQSDAARNNNTVDSYYDLFLDKFIRRNIDTTSFTHVLVEYVVYSKALLNFSSGVTRIIDMHDALTDRYKIYLENNTVPEFRSLHADQEIKGFNRADYVIAIQDADKLRFAPQCKARVETIGHFTTPVKAPSATRNALLFVGSGNKINIDGINHFIKEVLPKLVSIVPDVKLLIAGNICQSSALIAPHESIELLGSYDDPLQVYPAGTVVIVPLYYGTGLKIKTIEALSFGKAVVTYNEGIKGLPDPDESSPYCLLAKDADEFARHAAALLKDEALLKSVEDRALQYMVQYNQQNLKAFNRIFPSS